MDLEIIKNILIDWVKNKPFIRKVYIYGSRAREDFREDSDLDIALEFDPVDGDENCLTTWCGEAEIWHEELQPHFPFKLQLEYYEGDQTPTVKSGVERSCVLVYEREKI